MISLFVSFLALFRGEFTSNSNLSDFREDEVLSREEALSLAAYASIPPGVSRFGEAIFLTGLPSPLGDFGPARIFAAYVATCLNCAMA